MLVYKPKRTLSEICKTAMRDSEYRIKLTEAIIRSDISEESKEKFKNYIKISVKICQ